MSAPILDKFNEFNKRRNFPFHMPGHKGRREFIPDDLFSFDITEINGFDNLHKPEGIIAESQKLCAELFGADYSFYLVNGSTSGIMAAITALCKRGDKIIVARNCHKSVYNGIILSGAVPVYVMPDYTFLGTSGVISLEDFEEVLRENPDVKAAVITSPNYEGLCSDIKSIASILHKKNIPLIVDEAHGAHFAFSDRFPDTALSLGGDIVIQSLHKTLPVLTQCSVLHIKSDIVDRNKVAQAVSMFTSTSPSYIFMSVIDNCQDILSRKAKELFKNYTDNLDCFYDDAGDLKTIKILTKSDIIDGTSAFDNDFGKIIALIDNKNVISVEKSLRKYYNINVEMHGMRHILFMTSFCDTRENFFVLKNALREIDCLFLSDFSEKNNYCFENRKILNENAETDKPVCVMSPFEAFYSKYERVAFEDSMGLVSGEFIIPYPPGIPVVVPGELITARLIEKIRLFQKSGVEIIGCEDCGLDTVNVIL